jgi:hypothetical protein
MSGNRSCLTSGDKRGILWVSVKYSKVVSKGTNKCINGGQLQWLSINVIAKNWEY